MPNRKTFDEAEKYDHSSHPLGERQPSDLKADIKDQGDREVGRAAREKRASAVLRKRRP